MKPMHENLDAVRVENEAGDLVPVMDYAGEKLSELVSAIESHNKAGVLTMKISVKPSTAGALAVKAEVAIKKPVGAPPEALLWATPEGNLVADDPRQKKLELKAVPEQTRKVVSLNK